MLTGFYGGGMIPIFPESAFALLALVIFLSCTAGDQLHGRRDAAGGAMVFDQKVHMIAGHREVEKFHSEAFAGFAEPENKAAAVAGEFKKEFLFVTTMGDMPDAAWDVMPIGSCHGFSPPRRISCHYS